LLLQYGSDNANFSADCLAFARWLCAVTYTYEGWNFNSGNYLFTADTK